LVCLFLLEILMMKLNSFWLVFVLLSSTAILAGEPADGGERFWPQWRGPDGNGVATDSDPPVQWNESKNLRWKVDLPGRGSSSPIVWRNQIFVTTAVSSSQDSREPVPQRSSRGMPILQPTSSNKFILYSIDRTNGDILWERTLREEMPHEGTHPTGTWASNSAVTDGTSVFAYFGSRGLYALDFRGNLLWEKDFGNMEKKLSFGEGSSPALHGDRIVVVWDHEGQSYLFTLDKRTGDEIWKVERDEQTSWSSPVIIEVAGTKQVIVSSTGRIRAYNLEDGEPIWECEGMTANVIPMPVVVDDVVILMSGFRGNALVAVNLAEAKGDVTGSEAVLWQLDRDTPYVPSPLLYDDSLYFLKTNSGILSCFKAKTGKQIFGPQRLEGLGTVYSSPVGTNDRVYISDRDGNTIVLRHGTKFEVLANNSLDDGFDASPAIVGNEIIMRGQKTLYCIARN
jgi:outer membrane protein assembly factor BamB